MSVLFGFLVYYYKPHSDFPTFPIMFGSVFLGFDPDTQITQHLLNLNKIWIIFAKIYLDIWGI